MINLILTDRFVNIIQTIGVAEESALVMRTVIFFMGPREPAQTSAALMHLFMCSSNSAQHL